MLGHGPCRPRLLVSSAGLRCRRSHAERCKGRAAGGAAASRSAPEAAVPCLRLLGTGKAGNAAPCTLRQVGYMTPSRSGDGMRLVLARRRLLHCATAPACLASSGALAHLLQGTASLLLVSAGTRRPLPQPLVLCLRRCAVHCGAWMRRPCLMG